jgi:DNA ligase-1
MAQAAKKLMLAETYEDSMDPTGNSSGFYLSSDCEGWWLSEKLDGMRAYWSGSSFWSRQVSLETQFFEIIWC